MRRGAEADETHLLDSRIALEACADRRDADAASPIDREAIDAGRYLRKRERADAVLRGERHARAIAACQQFVLPCVPALPYRAHGVDHPLCLQAKARCDF